MIADFRSDTVTKPTAGMLQAMMQAKVGDDVFEEDETIKELEQKLAKKFGMEAGLFCPSGTMSNQIAIKLLTQPQQEVICDRLSHIYAYEAGGIAFNSGVSVRLINGDRGRITPQDVLKNINPDNIHHPVTSLVAIENTSNRGGGSCYSSQEMIEISKVCKANSLSLHLDGARIFNALVRRGEKSEELGKYFDTISVCLSKGLGAPAGSVLTGSKELIKKTKRIRKVLGGGMRQAGFLAAAGIYAIENHIERLKDDHKRAKEIEEIFKKKSYVQEILPVETNIIIFKLREKIANVEFVKKLEEYNIKATSFGKQYIRLVTHLDINDSMIEKLRSALKRLSF